MNKKKSIKIVQKLVRSFGTRTGRTTGSNSDRLVPTNSMLTSMSLRLLPVRYVVCDAGMLLYVWRYGWCCPGFDNDGIPRCWAAALVGFLPLIK